MVRACPRRRVRCAGNLVGHRTRNRRSSSTRAADLGQVVVMEQDISPDEARLNTVKPAAAHGASADVGHRGLLLTSREYAAPASAATAALSPGGGYQTGSWPSLHLVRIGIFLSEEVACSSDETPVARSGVVAPEGSSDPLARLDCRRAARRRRGFRLRIQLHPQVGPDRPHPIRFRREGGHL